MPRQPYVASNTEAALVLAQRLIQVLVPASVRPLSVLVSKCRTAKPVAWAVAAPNASVELGPCSLIRRAVTQPGLTPLIPRKHRQTRQTGRPCPGPLHRVVLGGEGLLTSCGAASS